MTNDFKSKQSSGARPPRLSPEEYEMCIRDRRDTNNVAFMNYESLPKFQGSSEIDSSLYDKVFEGEVNCFTLEKLYEIFNLEHPAGYKGRSMSVSDVVEIIDAVSYTHLDVYKRQVQEIVKAEIIFA